jgi:hypothetical protein
MEALSGTLVSYPTYNLPKGRRRGTPKHTSLIVFKTMRYSQQEVSHSGCGPNGVGWAYGFLLARIMLWVLLSATCLFIPAPARADSIPKHVLTADYLGRASDTVLPASQLSQFLDWAETSWQYNPQAVAAGIKVMYYTDPNRLNDTNPMYSTDESVYAHDCNGNRLRSLYYHNMFLADPSSVTLQKNFQQLIASRSANRHWDAFFVDDAFTTEGLSGLPCGFDPDKWLEAEKRLIASVHVPIVYNGLEISKTRQLNVLPNVIGGMEEGCYSGSVRFPKMWDHYWTQIENTELAMARDKKLFFCYGRDTTPAAGAIDGRLFTYASFLLTYTLESSILWEYYATPSKFRVEPETGLVALDPVVSSPVDVSALQQQTGVYAREYRNCYLRGEAVGPCAAVVNPSRSTWVDYPFGDRYKHTLQLTGAGIFDGGTVSVNGPSPPERLPPLTGIVVFR